MLFFFLFALNVRPMHSSDYELNGTEACYIAQYMDMEILHQMNRKLPLWLCSERFRLALLMLTCPLLPVACVTCDALP